jgi:DNA polymerase III alpha subunit
MKCPYAELHAHSNFSFLDGASHIEELVLQAQELGYEALALTDHDGLHGAMEFAQCARAWGLRPITGAEVTLSDGSADSNSSLRDKSRSFPKAEGFNPSGFGQTSSLAPCRLPCYHTLGCG